MLQAMNTGHDGSLTTVHANSPRDVLSRLETMVLMAGVDIPLRAIHEQISSAINLIVHQARLKDGTRRLTHVTEIVGMEGDVITLQNIYEFDYGAGIDENGRFRGIIQPTGLRPRFLERLSDRRLLRARPVPARAARSRWRCVDESPGRQHRGRGGPAPARVGRRQRRRRQPDPGRAAGGRLPAQRGVARQLEGQRGHVRDRLDPSQRLDQGNFAAAINGQPVDVAEATPLQEQQGERGKVAVMLAVDTSGSMQVNNNIARARAAAAALVQRMPPGTRLGLVAFSDRPRVVQQLTVDPQQVRQAIATLEADGDTALYDAVVLGKLLSKEEHSTFGGAV